MKSFHYILLLSMSLLGTNAPRAQHGQAFGKSGNADTSLLNQKIESLKNIDDHDLAVSQADKLLDLCSENNYKAGYVATLKAMGIIYGNKGNFNALHTTLKKAIAYTADHKDLYDQFASLYNSLGIYYLRTGNYDSAINCYYKAIAMQDKYSSSISKSSPYSNLGLVFRRLARYDQAIVNFRKAAEMADRENNYKIVATVLLNMGGVYNVMKNKDSFYLASNYLNKALSLAKKHGYTELEHKGLYELGLLADYRNMPLLAQDYYEAALKISYGKLYDDLIPRINLGGIYYKQKKLDQAQSLLEEGLRMANTMTPPPEYLCDFYYHLAQVYQAQDKHRMAAEYFSRYIELSENLRGKEVNQRIDQLQLQYETVKRDNELVKKQLLITRQEAIIQRKNTITYLILAGVLLVTILVLLYYRSRRRKQKQEEEKALWNAMMQGEEKERARIARELHDNIGGSLSNAKMWFASIQKDFTGLPRQEKDFDGALHLLDSTLTEVRDTAHRLMPELVLRHGLAEAVRIYCENVQRASGIKVKYHYLGFLGPMDKNLELMLYRTIQELLQNVVKHSHAVFVLVQLSYHDSMLSVTVEDNGIGMDLSGKNLPENGMGLLNIHRGLANMNGTFSIRSARNSGTSVCFEIEVKEQGLKS